MKKRIYSGPVPGRSKGLTLQFFYVRFIFYATAIRFDIIDDWHCLSQQTQNICIAFVGPTMLDQRCTNDISLKIKKYNYED